MYIHIITMCEKEVKTERFNDNHEAYKNTILYSMTSHMS